MCKQKNLEWIYHGAVVGWRSELRRIKIQRNEDVDITSEHDVGMHLGAGDSQRARMKRLKTPATFRWNCDTSPKCTKDIANGTRVPVSQKVPGTCVPITAGIAVFWVMMAEGDDVL